MTYFRSGNRNPRNIYRVDDNLGDVHVANSFDEEFGPIIVAALNAWYAREDQAREGDKN